MSALHQFWFSLRQGLPITLQALGGALEKTEVRRALLCFLKRSLTDRPFASLPKPDSPGDRFTRRQLEPVLLLQNVLEQDLGLPRERALPILERLVSQTGARFIEQNIKLPNAVLWQSYDPAQKDGLVQKIMARFENAETKLVRDAESEVAFDVTFCHFAKLTRALGREELAPFFCKADSVYFSDPEVPVVLIRNKTIAQGDDRCDFRFQFKTPKA